MHLEISRSWGKLSAAALFIVLFAGRDATASFHFMRIRQVLAGAGGNDRIQFVEIQLTSLGQNFVGGQILQFFDATGKLTDSYTFPHDADDGADGGSILVGTQEFADVSTVAPDFILPRPMVNAPAGRVKFVGSAVDPSVSYGSYTGSMKDGLFNYVAPAAALPVDGLQSLLRIRTLSPFNNSTDFSLSTLEPRNNAGATGSIVLPPTCSLLAIGGPGASACLTLGDTLQMDGSGSAGSGPLSFHFEVAPLDGVTIQTPDSSATSITFIHPGNYDIHLTVRDGSVPSTCVSTVCVQPPAGQHGFQRGDCNSDHEVNITDVIFLLTFQFIGGVAIQCDEACDANQDGDKNITDAIFTLNFLFLGTTQIPPPYPACEVIPTTGCLGETCVSTG